MGKSKYFICFLIMLAFFPGRPELFAGGKKINGTSTNKGRDNFRLTTDLSGRWQFALDPDNKGIAQKWYSGDLADSILLPGTTDLNKKGFLNTDTTTMHLNRVYKYEGAAWYRKVIYINPGWENRHVELVLERTKPSEIWIDDNFAGASLIMESPQSFDVTNYLTTGRHAITIRVDNSLKLTPYGNVHIYSEDTQTNWNGIIGRIYLQASDKSFIKNIGIYPDIAGKKFKAEIAVDNGLGLKQINIKFEISEELNNKIFSLKPAEYNVKCDSLIELEYSLGGQTDLWDEYHRPLYHLNVIISGKSENVHDNMRVTFGMREFSTRGTNFTINGRTTFLRGKNDACVFPLTGFPPTDTAGWMRVFRIAKSYGINHYRFHSWCPPEAAFEAADRLGIYIQAELPFWGDLNSDSVARDLLNEGLGLLKNYANHPSFVMLSPGNEIWGGHERVEKIIDSLKKIDSRLLYTQGTNNNIGYRPPAPYENYHIAARTPYSHDTTLTHTRLSMAFADSRDGGILNSRYPSTNYDYSYPVSQIKIPLVGHEVGQYQIYPDFSEIKKYTGILKPWNLEVFKSRLKKAGMLGQDKDFTKASGALSALCYKAEIETALRTRGFAGFQLLDLQDYPGQGTALVGILDAFMDSKNVISRKGWRQFCSDVVPMLEFKKYCWTNKETFSADIVIANYSNNNIHQNLKWEASDKNGKIIFNGTVKDIKSPYGGLYPAGKIEIPLSKLNVPEKLQIKLFIENTAYSNSYNIWIYPEPGKLIAHYGIIITADLTGDILKRLEAGAKVLLFPPASSVRRNSVPGMFIPDFWNYGMFKKISEGAKKPVSPGTMGILTDPEHPLFNKFPTDFYTNWQWWSIIKNGNPLILNAAGKSYRPIVQVIDNLERNDKMGLIFEFKVGKGKLLICMSDLRKIMKYPEAARLYTSIIDYMRSGKFNPEFPADEKLLNELLQ